MVTMIGSFATYSPELQIALRVAICRDTDIDNYQSKKFYIIGFAEIPLSTLAYNVTVPAMSIIQGGIEGDPTIIIQAILHSELEEITFDFQTKNRTCSLWFRCLKQQPRAVIPREDMDKYFDQDTQ